MQKKIVKFNEHNNKFTSESDTITAISWSDFLRLTIELDQLKWDEGHTIIGDYVILNNDN
ncbi:hypothetical protein TSUD_45550 [Trifolium subterraneum]|nr:hypothetical protein TSUD_45550 [Trifolium subterraneum]